MQIPANQNVLLIPINRHHSTSDQLNGSPNYSPTGATNWDTFIQTEDPAISQWWGPSGIHPVDRYGLPPTNITDEFNQPRLTHNGQDIQDMNVDRMDYGGNSPNSHNDAPL